MEPQGAKAPKLVRIEVQYIQGLKAALVEHIPDRGLVPVAGKNGSGKTSLIRAIDGALGGRGRVHERPVNDESPDGSGYTFLTLDSGWEIKRNHTAANPKGALYVTGPDGGKHGQTKLDEIMRGVDPDVQSFFSLPTSRQAEILLGLGTDPDLPRKLNEFAAREAALRDERTPHISLQRRAQGVKMPEGDRPEPQDISALTEQLITLQGMNDNRKELWRVMHAKEAEATAAVQAVALQEVVLEGSREDVRILERKLIEARQKVEAEERELAARRARVIECQTSADEVRKEAEAFPDPEPEIEAVKASMRQQQTIDALLDPWKKWDEAQQILEAETVEVDRLTLEIKAVAEERTKAIADAQIPVRGATFSENGDPSYNGRPLELASGAERVRLALDVARAKGLGFTLIDEGDVLDDDTLAAIDAEAREGDGMQVIICSVGRMGNTIVEVADGVARMVGET
jgi:energy-coupling factor transporter ATP-binding protein EcfA2